MFGAGLSWDLVDVEDVEFCGTNDLPVSTLGGKYSEIQGRKVSVDSPSSPTQTPQNRLLKRAFEFKEICESSLLSGSGNLNHKTIKPEKLSPVDKNYDELFHDYLKFHIKKKSEKSDEKLHYEIAKVPANDPFNLKLEKQLSDWHFVFSFDWAFGGGVFYFNFPSRTGDYYLKVIYQRDDGRLPYLEIRDGERIWDVDFTPKEPIEICRPS